MSWGVREGEGGEASGIRDRASGEEGRTPSVRCADTSPVGTGEAQEGAGAVFGCSCAVVMRMVWGPWWLDGWYVKKTALYKGGGVAGLCAQSRSVSGRLLAAKVLWGLG